MKCHYHVIHSHVTWQVKPALSLRDWCRFVHYKQIIPEWSIHQTQPHRSWPCKRRWFHCYWNSCCLLCHVPHVIMYTPHNTARPTSHTALQPPPLHPSLSLFRVQRDWKSGRIPVHCDTNAQLHVTDVAQLLCIWWREFLLHVWNSAEISHTFSAV